jgi:glucosamine kinase
MTPGLLLGLDGGGTGSRLALADAGGHVLTQVQGPGLDPTADAGWQDRLARLTDAAGQTVQAAVLGLPFHGELKAVSLAQTHAATRLIGPQARVVNDVAVAAAGALAGRPGVLVLSGTGSMAWAINGTRSARAGGFGDRFGDEGSAFDIGRRALQRVSWHLDGRANAPALAQALLSRLGCGAEGLIDWAYGPQGTRAAVAGLARDVAALAEAGDRDADALLAEAAGHLAAQARAAARLAALPEAFDWSHAGGTFAAPALLRHLTQALGRPPLAPRLSPLGGALLMAAQDAGLPVPDAFLDTLARGLAAPAPKDTTAP